MWIKKIDKINSNFLALRTRRKTKLLNSDNEQVYTIKDNELKFAKSKNYMYFYNEDSLIYGTHSGNITDNREVALKESNLGNHVTFQEGEFHFNTPNQETKSSYVNAVARDGGPNEYEVETNFLMYLYDRNLNKLSSIIGTEIYEINSFTLVQNGSYFQLFDEEGRTVSIESRFY